MSEAMATQVKPNSTYFATTSGLGPTMPSGLPALRHAAAPSASFASTSGWAMLPRWPIEAERSAGPMKIESTPGTAAISGRRPSASIVSIWHTTHSSAAAFFW